MRILIIILATMASIQASAQFAIKGGAKASSNFQRNYYQTSVDIDGLVYSVEGTIDNIFSIGQNVLGIFSNDPEIEEGPDWITYTYGDRVITEKMKQAPKVFPQVGADLGWFPVQRYADAFVSIYTGKYKIIGIDASANLRVFPGYIANQISYTHELVDYFFMGYSRGFDTTYPGLLEFRERGYHGVTFGYMYPIKNLGEIHITAQLDQKKRKKGHLRQGNVSIGVNVEI